MARTETSCVCGAPTLMQSSLALFGFYDIATDLPDVSNRIRGNAQSSDREATVHGVVFDILGPGAAQAMRPACRAGSLGSVGRQTKGLIPGPQRDRGGFSPASESYLVDLV